MRHHRGPGRALRPKLRDSPTARLCWSLSRFAGGGNRFPVQVGAEAPGLLMNGTMAASSHRIMLGPLVAAIDQGTSSTRFLVRKNQRSSRVTFTVCLTQVCPNRPCPWVGLPASVLVMQRVVRRPQRRFVTSVWCRSSLLGFWFKKL